MSSPVTNATDSAALADYSPPLPSTIFFLSPPLEDSGFWMPPADNEALQWGLIGGRGILALLAVGIFFLFYKKKKLEDLESAQGAEKLARATTSRLRPVPVPVPPPSSGIAFGYSLCKFSCEGLERATNGFSKLNLLGRGGFANVYKGVLPVPDEKVIAVKQMSSGSVQGECEFRAEVDTISRIHHKNLVSLVGYCIDGDQRMLVYEFVPNKTLDFHLHGKERPTMNWPTRMKIALGSAEGLAYLHEHCQPKIIHRDIKAANILIDNNSVAKVVDFGLAKFLLETKTHVSTLVKGTFGYLDPDYATSKKLTDKSDVFSFGVVLLELISGRKPIDETGGSMVQWARPLLKKALKNGNFDGLVDPRLQNVYSSREMTQMVGCVAICVRGSAQRRPRMSQIIQVLKGNISLDALDESIPPANSKDYDSSQYKKDLKKFRKIVENQEQGTSEYSRPSSKSGIHPSASSSRRPKV